ncbi:agmatinase [Aestuariicella hydrocarbonica]|uniref:Agmatinase n=1 Tax=Pseudomaricurvus hydrocarbonicus TaxID=1470433 RepID=A0A9E5JQP5_9GAMM|nr:agmatinase [Aestuariicella hydrocarbonica]NHO64923.1 agmatinase [Aestuariicella hydrocarbonica]
MFGAESNTFSNIFTYLGLPLSRELAAELDAVVMGVPYDLATTGRSGTRFGPTGIRQASSQLRWEAKRFPWRFALSERFKVQDYGDLDFEEGNSDEMLALVQAHASRILAAGKKLVTLGGDHFISLPLLRAVHETHGQVALLHFDAHTDTEASDAKYNHGAMFYHADKEGLYDPAASVQVGIRTEYDYDTHPMTVLDASWVNNHSTEQVTERIKSVIGERPVYLSFDIDCLDPAFAPGTGTPVAGGLTSDRALQIIRSLGDLNIVGMDLMEVSPAYDHADVTSLAAATLVLEMLYLLASQKKV